MSDILKDIKGFIIPIKLSDYDVGLYTRLIEKQGGSICQSQKESTHIFTALKSVARIGRNVENHQIPVINIQWIKDCDKTQELLPLGDYTIITARKKALVSASEDVNLSSAPDVLNRRFVELPPEELQFQDDGNTKTKNNSDSESDEPDIDIAPGFINTKYECLRPTPYEPKFNKKLVSLLLLLERKRQLDGEDKRSLSYRHAISAIKAYPRKIQSPKEAAKIIGIGTKMVDKIRQFLATGTIEEAEQLRHDEKFRTMSLFNKVHGVGATTAKIWWDLGYRTLQEVLDKAKLTATVQLGISLFPDFNQLMSRSDVEEIIEIIEKEVQVVDSKSFVTPVGGYRRGKPLNGDLDLMISSHSGTVQGLLNKLTKRLSDTGYLRYKLWHSSEIKPHKKADFGILSGKKHAFDGLEKCIGAFIQPSTGIHRQVDLITVTLEELPLAVLGWTGSRQFERSLRDFAKKEKNLSVNSQTIHLETNGKRRKLLVKSEEEAFKVIGVPYLEPELRNC